LARGDAEEIKSAIISDLSRCYGEKASSPSSIHFIDWSYANFNVDQIQAQENHNQHLNYGSKELRSAFNRRVIFSGTESEEAQGHMEGAVRAGVRSANEAFAVAMGTKRRNSVT
jgi:monoamine oxidase